MKVHVVFARHPNKPEAIFIDVEHAKTSKSVRVGKWIEREDGMAVLELDIIDAPVEDVP